MRLASIAAVAAKQVNGFMRPGWHRVRVALSARDPKDVYSGRHNPMRHYRTTRTEDARLVEEKGTETGVVWISVPEGSIFT